MENAEYEVIQRVVQAGVNIGAGVFVIDNDGRVLSSYNRNELPDGRRITSDDCDFLISLHFESPKLIDVYSYVTLWNPPIFFKLFGYDAAVQKLVSHDCALSCGSRFADAHAANVFMGYNRALDLPLPRLYHSLPGPYLTPKIDENARLFYVGINWERISGQRGRHQDLLERLDEADLVSIYGPQWFLGTEPWAGFKCYRGSIPFDGRSILDRINDAGVCLAFSSKPHQKFGIMSNRLFEGLAAGAAIIANTHPIIDEYFSDCVYVVDDDAMSPSEVADSVSKILAEIRDDPTEALRRAHIGQTRLKERFSLETSLEELYATHEERARRSKIEVAQTGQSVEVLVVYKGVDLTDLDHVLEEIRKQRGVNPLVTIVCDKRLVEDQRTVVEAMTGRWKDLRFVTGDLYPRSGPVATMRPTQRKSPTGPLVAQALASVRAPSFCFVDPSDCLFADHFVSLAAALDRSPKALAAASGWIEEQPQIDKRPKRELRDLIFRDAEQVLFASEMQASGRFLFRTTLVSQLPAHLIECLDGTEMRALALWAYLNAPLTQTASATLVCYTDPLFQDFEVLEEELQVETILDSVRSNDVWLRRTYALERPPATSKRAAQIDVDRPYLVAKDQDGRALIVSGFSQPEPDFTWVDGLIGILCFNAPEGIETQDHTLILSVVGRPKAETGENQLCTVRINDDVAVTGQEVVPGRQDIRISLAGRELSQGKKVVVRMELGHAEQVFDTTGRILDARKLGMQVKSLEVRRDPRPDKAPMIADGLSLKTAAGGSGAACIVSGFCCIQDDRAWIQGKGRLRFRLPEDLASKCSAIDIRIGGLHMDTGPQTSCAVLVNGTSAVEDRLVEQGDGWLRFTRANPSVFFSEGVNTLDIVVANGPETGANSDDDRSSDHLPTHWVSDVRLALDEAEPAAKTGGAKNLRSSLGRSLFRKRF